MFRLFLFDLFERQTLKTNICYYNKNTKDDQKRFLIFSQKNSFKSGLLTGARLSHS